MPAGRHKSRTLRRVFVKTPGGSTTKHFRRRKPSKALCGNCHQPLPGVPRELPSKVRAIPKSARSPTRAYGGNLCSKCTRQTLKAQARAEQ